MAVGLHSSVLSIYYNLVPSVLLGRVSPPPKCEVKMAAPRMNETEISKRTGLAVTSLRKWRSLSNLRGKRVGPPYEKIQGRVYYRLNEVEGWIQKEAYLNAS